MTEEIERLKRKVEVLEAELKDVKARCVLKEEPTISTTVEWEEEETDEAEPTTESEPSEEETAESHTEE